MGSATYRRKIVEVVKLHYVTILGEKNLSPVAIIVATTVANLLLLLLILGFALLIVAALYYTFWRRNRVKSQSPYNHSVILLA